MVGGPDDSVEGVTRTLEAVLVRLREARGDAAGFLYVCEELKGDIARLSALAPELSGAAPELRARLADLRLLLAAESAFATQSAALRAADAGAQEAPAPGPRPGVAPAAPPAPPRPPTPSPTPTSPAPRRRHGYEAG